MTRDSSPPPALPRSTLLPLLVVGNLLVVALFAADLASSDRGIVGTGAYWGRDFVNLWTGGRLALNGRLDMLYDLAAYHREQRALFGAIGQHNYSYPPIALFLNLPFALLPYGVALAVWVMGSAALFVAAARPWWCTVSPRPTWLLVLAPAATLNIWAGHYGFLIGSLFLLGFAALPRRKALAGLCFALMAVKPHLAVLVPLVLILRGEWRAFGWAAATVMALVAASVAAFGAGLWEQYLTVTLGVQAALIDPGGSFFGFMATSWASALLRAGLSPHFAWGVQGAVAALAVAGLVLARRAPPVDLALLAATATFLVLPYGFNYDLIVVALVAAMLVERRDLSPGRRMVAMVALVAPQFGMAAAVFGLPLLPAALLALFVLQLRLALSTPIGRAVPAAASEAHST